MEAMKAETIKLDSERKTLEDRVGKINRDISQLSEKRTKINTTLELHERLESLGFNEDSLRRLKEAPDKYGGPADILRGLTCGTTSKT